MLLVGRRWHGRSKNDIGRREHHRFVGIIWSGTGSILWQVLGASEAVAGRIMTCGSGKLIGDGSCRWVVATDAMRWIHPLAGWNTSSRSRSFASSSRSRHGEVSAADWTWSAMTTVVTCRWRLVFELVNTWRRRSATILQRSCWRSWLIWGPWNTRCRSSSLTTGHTDTHINRETHTHTDIHRRTATYKAGFPLCCLSPI